MYAKGEKQCGAHSPKELFISFRYFDIYQLLKKSLNHALKVWTPFDENAISATGEKGTLQKRYLTTKKKHTYWIFHDFDDEKSSRNQKGLQIIPLA